MILSARFGRATGHVPAPARNMRTVIRPQCGKPRRKESLPWTTGTCATQRGCVLSSCFEQKWLKSPGSNTGGADVSAARGHGRAQADALPGLPAGEQGAGTGVAAGRPRQAGEGARAPAAREPRRGAGVCARDAGAGGDGAVARPPARGGAARGVPRRRRRRGGRARPMARAGAAAAGRPRSRGCRARRGESGRASRGRPGSGSPTPASRRRATRPRSRPGGATGPTTSTTPWPS